MSEQIEKRKLATEVPELFVKCPNCNEILIKDTLIKNLNVCYKCGSHFTLTAYDRINTIADDGTFEETNSTMDFVNPIDFPDYKNKMDKLNTITQLKEAVITGKCKIDGQEAMLGVMDNRFLMASMGIIVGEKITRMFEDAIKYKCPTIMFICSGGARMQEGIFSLMQMAKTSLAVSELNNNKLLYISVLTHPTTGGVSASFAALGDIILAEPNALIGFAGPRVIEQTVKQTLPDGFQRSEFQLEHGFIDQVVERRNMKKSISRLIKFHNAF